MDLRFRAVSLVETMSEKGLTPRRHVKRVILPCNIEILSFDHDAHEQP